MCFATVFGEFLINWSLQSTSEICVMLSVVSTLYHWHTSLTLCARMLHANSLDKCFRNWFIDRAPTRSCLFVKNGAKTVHIARHNHSFFTRLFLFPSKYRHPSFALGLGDQLLQMTTCLMSAMTELATQLQPT